MAIVMAARSDVEAEAVEYLMICNMSTVCNCLMLMLHSLLCLICFIGVV